MFFEVWLQVVEVIVSAAHGGSGGMGSAGWKEVVCRFSVFAAFVELVGQEGLGSEESICKAWSGGVLGVPPGCRRRWTFFRPNLEASIQNTAVQKSFHIIFLTPMGKNVILDEIAPEPLVFEGRFIGRPEKVKSTGKDARKPIDFGNH